MDLIKIYEFLLLSWMSTKIWTFQDMGFIGFTTKCKVFLYLFIQIMLQHNIYYSRISMQIINSHPHNLHA